MKKDLFTTPVWEDSFSLDFESVIQVCQRLKQENPSVNNSNCGGYQSPVFNLVEKLPELLEAIRPGIQNVAKDLQRNISLDGAWLNINGKNDFNLPHVHPMRGLSVVAYLQTPEESGGLVLYNPTALIHYPIPIDGLLFQDHYRIQPKPGSLVIFPSYLEHYVEPHVSEKPRVSIAMDIKIQ